MFLLYFYKTAGEQASEQVQILVNAIHENVYSMFDIQRRLNISSRRYVLVETLLPAICARICFASIPRQTSTVRNNSSLKGITFYL